GVEGLELLDLDAVRSRAFAAHLVRPELRTAEDGIRVDRIGAHADRTALERGDACELDESCLRHGVRPEAGAGRERVLRGDVDETAADPLLAQDRPDALGEHEVARQVDLEAAAPVVVGELAELARGGNARAEDDGVEAAVPA